MWRSVLQVKKNGVPEENHRPAVSHWQTYIMLYWAHLSMSGIQTHNPIVCAVIKGNIGNDQHDTSIALLSVLEMKILIYWSESNSWIYFYMVLNKNWKIYCCEQSLTGLGPDNQCSLSVLRLHRVHLAMSGIRGHNWIIW